ncbi:hypothetical protein ABTZ57_01370 [Streptomyces sp. NPDC094048]|uniref:hypothetical protein n=1 Tax=unclassified Streptomyces TaxID=2593676 RepID=UPI00332D604A
MSDHEDEMMNLAGERLASIYGGLVACCEMLPLPIALPKGIVSNLDMVPAVRRIEQLADEQPMPEDQQAQLYTAAISWLAATDLFSLLVNEEYVEARAAGVLGTLMIARDCLTDLGTWLLEQSS